MFLSDLRWDYQLPGASGALSEGDPAALAELEGESVLVRGRRVMDGATTLFEAATRLRGLADDLLALEGANWELQAAISDDVGVVRRNGTDRAPRPSSGRPWRLWSARRADRLAEPGAVSGRAGGVAAAWEPSQSAR